MALARRLLLRASRSVWLADQLRRRAFFRRAVRRFMPGEEIDAALGAAAELARTGIGTVLTQLGEQVTTPAAAAAVRDHYLGVLAQIRERRLSAQLSVKLTHLGLDVDRETCSRDVGTLAVRAAEAGSFLWIDMEEARYADAAQQRSVADDGCAVRVLISYGSAWFPWYMRRLAERPANVWFVVRNLF